MNKPCILKLLPTDKARLYFNFVDKLALTSQSAYQTITGQSKPQHLYLLSQTGEIKEDCKWGFHLSKKELIEIKGIGEKSGEIFHDKGFNKKGEIVEIIATINPELHSSGIAKISDADIKWFIEMYNKNGKFDVVEVEYESPSVSFGNWMGNILEGKLYLKLNPDGSICLVRGKDYKKLSEKFTKVLDEAIEKQSYGEYMRSNPDLPNEEDVEKLSWYKKLENKLQKIYNKELLLSDYIFEVKKKILTLSQESAKKESFTREEIVAFAEWIAMNKVSHSRITNEWTIYSSEGDDDWDDYTTEELFEEFLKQQKF